MLAASAQTQNACALLALTLPRGAEPPRRVPRQFTIGPPQARLLVLLAPGWLMEHFMAYSGPLPAECPAWRRLGPLLLHE